MKKILFLLLPLFTYAQTKTGASVNGYGRYQYQVFLTTGTFTPQKGVPTVDAQCWAGGGPGGNSSGSSSGRGSGGQGGGFAVKSNLAVVFGTTYTVTVAVSQTITTSNGGDSWFNSTATVLSKGGKFGTAGASVAAAAPTTPVSTGGIGDQIFYGGNGGAAGVTNSGAGGGGAGTGGNGGAATTSTVGTGTAVGGGNGSGSVSGGANGTLGINFGGAGSGASSNNTTGHTGGAGAPGQVILTWHTTHLGFF
jgi:hypothetical protein